MRHDLIRLKAAVRALRLALEENENNIRIAETKLGAFELLLARAEIMKSIAHRQDLIIQILDREIEWKESA